MIELFAYKLFNNYITEYVPEINWLDTFNNQYESDGESRPFKDTSCFIEFLPRTDITTTQKTISQGTMQVKFHLTLPRSDNYTVKKKNVNQTLQLFSTASKFNKYMNILDSSRYPSTSTYKDNLLIEMTNVYAMNTAELIETSTFYNDKFQIYTFTYLFEYVDQSSYIDMTMYSGWTYYIDYTIDAGTGDPVGAFNDDFGTSYDVRTDINYIWIEQIRISGSTMSISGYSFSQGIPMDLQYGVIGNDYQLPDYQDSNTFTGLAPGEYWVYLRDQRGVGYEFPSNPVTIT